LLMNGSKTALVCAYGHMNNVEGQWVNSDSCPEKTRDRNEGG
jgi:hypothetical protein